MTRMDVYQEGSEVSDAHSHWGGILKKRGLPLSCILNYNKSVAYELQNCLLFLARRSVARILSRFELITSSKHCENTSESFSFNNSYHRGGWHGKNVVQTSAVNIF